jgi:hypothetical protein
LSSRIWRTIPRAGDENPIKNPAEHREGEATGPEQRRGRCYFEQLGMIKIRQSPSTQPWVPAAQKDIRPSIVVPVMIIPVSIAVSIVLRQNLLIFLPSLIAIAFTPCSLKSYGKS